MASRIEKHYTDVRNVTIQRIEFPQQDPKFMVAIAGGDGRQGANTFEAKDIRNLIAALEAALTGS